ncbi:uroporphyrinogen decarboxylase [Neomegalonema perideroedes]|uniref:uroporphyrinogen decarboxylase n=1 Tax=Neomegalonema perideroedes TaxID=217219 RepID=UPI0003819157|nr:uroporphyrinogen decarboxylase [Neomegalonema perideroedes]
MTDQTPDKLLLRALSGEALPRPPVWLMRQAGRYLPEYRELRAKAGGFLELCYNPDFAVEATLQPIRRYGFDAAILFSDILVVPHALGWRLWFEQGEGPRLDVQSPEAPLPRLIPEDLHRKLAPVYETLGRLREELPRETTLIGFAGAPWTLATYLAAGRGKDEQAAARRWMFSHPESFQALIDLLTEATVEYLSRQIEAGAEAVQLFDSWAGALAPRAFARFSVAPARRVVEALQARHPGVPVIGFPRGAGGGYALYARETGISGLGLDTSVSPAWAQSAIPASVTLQGNLDPLTLLPGSKALQSEAEAILEGFAGRTHIFNLGHGITPEADPAQVERLLKLIRG